jgi:hypothetical protein
VKQLISHVGIGMAGKAIAKPAVHEHISTGRRVTRNTR